MPKLHPGFTLLLPADVERAPPGMVKLAVTPGLVRRDELQLAQDRAGGANTLVKESELIAWTLTEVEDMWCAERLQPNQTADGEGGADGRWASRSS